jgi:hypothetical protein
LSYWEFSLSPIEKQRLKRNVPTILNAETVAKGKIVPSIKVKRKDKTVFE